MQSHNFSLILDLRSLEKVVHPCHQVLAHRLDVHLRICIQQFTELWNQVLVTLK